MKKNNVALIVSGIIFIIVVFAISGAIYLGIEKFKSRVPKEQNKAIEKNEIIENKKNEKNKKVKNGFSFKNIFQNIEDKIDERRREIGFETKTEIEPESKPESKVEPKKTKNISNSSKFEFKDGKKIQTQVITDRINNVVTEKRFVDDKEDGTWVVTRDNIKVQTTEYDNGKILETLNYFPNGQISTRITYNGNDKDGKVEVYDENGYLVVVSYYKDKVPNGKVLRYHNQDGELKTITLVNGEVFKFYQGRVVQDWNFLNGEMSGTQKCYSPETGNLTCTHEFENGVEKLKIEYHYDEAGNLTCKHFIVDGKEVKYEQYGKNGKLIKTTNY